MYYLFGHEFCTLLDVILITVPPALTVSERFVIIICRPMNVTVLSYFVNIMYIGFGIVIFSLTLDSRLSDVSWENFKGQCFNGIMSCSYTGEISVSSLFSVTLNTAQ